MKITNNILTKFKLFLLDIKIENISIDNGARIVFITIIVIRLSNEFENGLNKDKKFKEINLSKNWIFLKRIDKIINL